MSQPFYPKKVNPISMDDTAIVFIIIRSNEIKASANNRKGSIWNKR